MNLSEIKNYDDICKLNGVDPIKYLPIQDPKTPEDNAINSIAKVFRINRVLNNGWVPDWNNFDQYKYHPWFDMETYEKDADSGSGFSCDGYFCDAYYSSLVGSRLVYKSRELAKFAGETFLAEYRGFMVIEPVKKD